MMNTSLVAALEHAGLVGGTTKGGLCAARYLHEEHRDRPRRMIFVRRGGAGYRNPE